MSPSSMSSCAGVWLCVTLTPSKWKRTALWALLDILDRYWEKMEPRGASWNTNTHTHRLASWDKHKAEGWWWWRGGGATDSVQRELLWGVSVFALQPHSDAAAAAGVTSILCCHDDTLCTTSTKTFMFCNSEWGGGSVVSVVSDRSVLLLGSVVARFCAAAVSLRPQVVWLSLTDMKDAQATFEYHHGDRDTWRGGDVTQRQRVVKTLNVGSLWRQWCRFVLFRLRRWSSDRRHRDCTESLDHQLWWSCGALCWQISVWTRA